MAKLIDSIPENRIVNFANELKKQPNLMGMYSKEELLEIFRRADMVRRKTDGIAVALHGFTDASTTESTADVLQVRDLTYPLDKIVVDARQATSNYYRDLLSGPGKSRISTRNITATIAAVTKRLNARGLQDIERALLALPAVYEYLLIEAIDAHHVDSKDEQGLCDQVLRSVRVEPRHYLLDEITARVLEAEKITLKDPELQSLQGVIFKKGVNLRVGSVRSSILKLVEDDQRIGGLSVYVDRYIARGEIEREMFTDDVKEEMANFLYARGIQITDAAAFDSGVYDEYFALAYTHAVSVTQGQDDPVDVARSKARVSDWDFTIRRISESDRPIINAQAILAAGALYTTFVEGEQMRVFDIGDSLLMDWHRGELDIPDGKTASMLNRYEILMRDRPTEEERHMHYKRIFNIGEAEMLSGTVVNEAFPGLWDNLMYEVTRYIDKTERYYTEEKFISRTAMYQAIKELQYNLSEYMTGSAPKKTHEMYSHLGEALDIIGSEDVLNHIGGRRKSILAVIERMGKASLGVAIPTTNLITIAERGNDIFRFIADFVEENVADDEFQRFLDDCKACIVSQAALEPETEDEGFPEDSVASTFKNGNGALSGHGYRSLNGNLAQRKTAVGERRNGNNFDDWES